MVVLQCAGDDGERTDSSVKAEFTYLKIKFITNIMLKIIYFIWNIKNIKCQIIGLKPAQIWWLKIIPQDYNKNRSLVIWNRLAPLTL